MANPPCLLVWRGAWQSKYWYCADSSCDGCGAQGMLLEENDPRIKGVYVKSLNDVSYVTIQYHLHDCRT